MVIHFWADTVIFCTYEILVTHQQQQANHVSAWNETIFKYDAWMHIEIV